jgi:UDP-glucose 4-epimerase
VSLIAVTGADGFIGSHLVEALVERGDRVRALVQYNSLCSHGWLDDLPLDTLDHVDVVLGDVRDAGQMMQFVEGADAVCHLAALIAIPFSYVAPASYVATNVIGTLNVLEAVRRHRTARMVHTSTSEVYGTARFVPINEAHPMQAQSPYSASKIAADKLAESYQLSFDLPVVTLRPFNTYGPRQSARAVIPTVVSQLAAGQRVVHLGATTPTRDFNFVADTVAAFIALIDAPHTVVGEVFNAGSGREVSIGDTVQLIAAAMGVEVGIICEAERLRPQHSEVQRLLADADALHQATGWKPHTTLEDGLEATVKWFSDPSHLARYRPTTYQL